MIETDTSGPSTLSHVRAQLYHTTPKRKQSDPGSSHEYAYCFAPSDSVSPSAHRASKLNKPDLAPSCWRRSRTCPHREEAGGFGDSPKRKSRASKRRLRRLLSMRARNQVLHPIARFKRKGRKPASCGPAPPETQARSCGSPLEPRGRGARGSKGLQIPSIRNQRARSRGRARATSRAAPPGVRINRINPLAPNFPSI